MSLSYHDRVEALYKKYDPAKVAQTDATLVKYAGKEEMVIAALVKKYGPEPTGNSMPGHAAPSAVMLDATPHEPAVAGAGALSHRDRLMALYEKYDPAKVCQTDAMLVKFAGKEAALIAALAKKYGAEPMPVDATPPEASHASSLTYRDRVEALYKKYDPAKVGQTDATLAKYRGKEAAVIAALVKKYGPEPTPASTDYWATAPTSKPAGSRTRTCLVC
uniref:Uncharacterized protein n=1 Tax=Neobodo designis TaxID=312471 RepID=A0A7S1LQ08_NEODS|mmetsp:Transcript_26266/g.81128  ORF Transcript_26266/g.81128 Transcript_26266/m.81128 type:complete len:219 (+) Transcript_26266:51-707(+)